MVPIGDREMMMNGPILLQDLSAYYHSYIARLFHYHNSRDPLMKILYQYHFWKKEGAAPTPSRRVAIDRVWLLLPQ
jgi:hypothetical protein